ncbi:MAG TPA: helix-turn-helix transcriptional regulator [Bryobacteraceae bacterium]|jgi:hypothetical protein|nr:helix-turn-helix transcriptional regulator [Bryobacteraceae bacterium]
MERRAATDALIDASILDALSGGPLHGYAVSEAIGRASDGLPALEEREIYAALHRLEFQGALASAWGVGDDHRRAKYYRLREACTSKPALALEVLALFSMASVPLPHVAARAPELQLP